MRNNERFLNLMTAIAAACAVVVTVIVVYRQLVVPSSLPAAATAPRATNRVVADWEKQIAESRLMGSQDTPLTVLYYGDFECPACRAFTRLISGYSEAHPGAISVAFRHLPLPYHRFAYPSARAAECAADQGRFDAMYKVLYDIQDSLGLLPFREVARRAMVPDLKRFDACTADTARVARIERDVAAAKATGIPGTPGVIIRGTLYAERLPTVSDLDQLVRDAQIQRRD